MKIKCFKIWIKSSKIGKLKPTKSTDHFANKTVENSFNKFSKKSLFHFHLYSSSLSTFLFIQDKNLLHTLKTEKPFLLSEFFPAKIFSCSERFPFSKIPEKNFGGKKFTEQKSFFAEQKRLVLWRQMAVQTINFCQDLENFFVWWTIFQLKLLDFSDDLEEWDLLWDYLDFFF